MNHRPLLFALVVTGPLALLSAVGCSSDDSGVSSVAEADLPSRIADAACRAGRKCSCDVPASCETNIARFFGRPEGGEALSYDAQCAGKVVAYYDALNSCRGFGESAQPTCCRVYYGPKRVGESCTPSDTLDDCGPGLRCAGGTCVALCGDAGKPQLGESCEFGSCAAGLWCDDSSGSAECAPLPGAGESCNDSFECAAGLNCVRLQSADVCVIPGALGEACEPYTCGDGMGCVEGVCATKKPAGSICEVDEECFGVCEGLCLDPRPEACFLFP